MSSVIPRWQSHVHTVIARQTLGLRLLDLSRNPYRPEVSMVQVVIYHRLVCRLVWFSKTLKKL